MTKEDYQKIICIPLKESKDPSILSKMTTPECKSYLLYIALNAFRDVLRNGKFTECKKTQEETEKMLNYISKSKKK